jgi:hypothetical protein
MCRYTATGLDLVRTSMFNVANGMRPDADGIPRVLIVVTDGEAGDSLLTNRAAACFVASCGCQVC